MPDDPSASSAAAATGATPRVVGPTSLGSPLIDVAALAAALRSTRPPVIWDIRWSLTGNGYDEFLAGRIPGAHFVDLDGDLAAPPGLGGRHPLPQPAVLEALMARTGVAEGTPLVVCGARDTSIAARAWWLMRWAGHRAVRVLDGGFQAWRSAGMPEESGPAAGRVDVMPTPHHSVRAATAAVTTGGMPTVDADGAAALGSGASAVLLDARAAERYRGEIEPVDPVPGHIPGAINLPLATIHALDGKLLPACQLRRVFSDAGVRDGVEAAASCGSGVTACSLILAAEVAGLQLALYPGSYSGWCALGRPVETTGVGSCGRAQ